MGTWDAEVTAAIHTPDGLFTDDAEDSAADLLSEAADAAEGEEESTLAHIEVLRYAPCLVAFKDRAMVFQELIDADKNVRAPSPLPTLAALTIPPHSMSSHSPSATLSPSALSPCRTSCAFICGVLDVTALGVERDVTRMR